MPWLSEWAVAGALPALAVAFVVLAMLETHRPRDSGTAAGLRWVTNFALYIAVFVWSAVFAPDGLDRVLLNGWGSGPLAVLTRNANPWLTLILSLIMLDGLSYGLHRMQHLRLFWRFHAVHHADEEIDLTTGLRHHPGEAFGNAIVGGAVLAVLGLPVWTLAVYGMVVPIFDMWTHVNLSIPPALERALSTVIVTPGAHRVHHSDEPADFGTNFGGILTIWDRLFSTWRSPTSAPLRFGLGPAYPPGVLPALLGPFGYAPRRLEKTPQHLAGSD